MIDASTLSPNLTISELQQITRKRTREKIREALAHAGIPFRLLPDGYPLVSRLAYEQVMGTQIKQFNTEPRLHLV
jgi:hypothetical protein